MSIEIHPRDRRDLLKICAFEESAYDSLALTSLTAYCVFWLREWQITPTLENLAVAALRMFPTKFAMVGWSEFPDITRISRSVLQMRPKYRNLATSVSAKGVFLNQRGIQEATSLVNKFGSPRFEGESSPARTGGSSARAELGRSIRRRSVFPDDLVAQIHKSHLSHLYKEGKLDTSEAIDLIGLLGVYDHTPSEEKRRKLKDLVDAARELGDDKTMEFLATVKERFHKYLNR